MNAPTPTRLVLHIEGEETATEEERDVMARQLLQEVREDLPDLFSADLVTVQSAETGAKSGEAVILGAVAVSVLPTLVPQLVEFVKAWTLRGPGRTVRVKLDGQTRGVEVEFDPTSISSTEVAELVRTLSESRRAPAADPTARQPPSPSRVSPASTLEIFIASSDELREDRDALDLYLRQMNDSLTASGRYLRVVRWENALGAMSQTRTQDEYNNAVRSCDVFISLFFTKTGQFTREEFHVAHAHFLETGRPYIYTFFKNAAITTGTAQRADLTSLWNFQDELTNLGHFYSRYDNIDQLKRIIRDQLDKL